MALLTKAWALGQGLPRRPHAIRLTTVPLQPCLGLWSPSITLSRLRGRLSAPQMSAWLPKSFALTTLLPQVFMGLFLPCHSNLWSNITSSRRPSPPALCSSSALLLFSLLPGAPIAEMVSFLFPGSCYLSLLQHKCLATNNKEDVQWLQ